MTDRNADFNVAPNEIVTPDPNNYAQLDGDYNQAGSSLASTFAKPRNLQGVVNNSRMLGRPIIVRSGASFGPETARGGTHDRRSVSGYYTVNSAY